MAKRTTVLLQGSQRWVRTLEDLLPDVGVATMLSTRDMMIPHPFVLRARWRWRQSDILHQVMLDVRSTNTGKVFRQARKRNIPVIVHWIGSDVIRLRDHIAEHGTPPAYQFDHITRHLADSPALAAELKELGVETDVVRLLPRSVNADAGPLPDAPAVLVYLPSGAEDFYRIDIIKSLAAAWPQVPFYIAANDGNDVGDCPANMQFLGEVKNMDALYRKVSVLIRICRHDSLSAMVLEALARGRYVIYSEPFRHTLQASDTETAMTQLAALLQQTKPNDAGAQMVATEFSWRREIERLCEIYRDVNA